jgi:hypothetical protein
LPTVQCLLPVLHTKPAGCEGLSRFFEVHMKSICPAFALAMVVTASAVAQTPVAIPMVTGPLAVTAESYPLMAADRTQEPVDLAKAGYVEEEYIVSGTANIYGRDANGNVTIKTADAPYATRILVRRPRESAQFSGNVIVEPVIEARNYDWAFIWALSYAHFMERGDVFVGVTHMPQQIDALKKFDPQRYAALSFANPDPAETCGPENSTSPSEEGLHCDVYSQVGRLLKSGAANGPLAGFDVEKLYMASHHGHAGTYAATIHALARLENGAPIYDGYLLGSSDVTMRLNRCDTAPARGDPLQIVRNVDVPVIRVVPQGEVLGTIATRRADSDDPNDRYRLYEIPGAPRMDRIYFQHLPVPQDQIKAGQSVSNGKWPYDYKCTPDIDLLDYPIKRYVINAAFANLDAWVRTGIPPPRAERLAVNNPGTPEAAFDTDEFGNAKGGVRHTYVEVPVATYSGNSPGQCGSIANKVPFDWAKLQSVYGTPQNYAQKITASLEKLVAERWLTETDAGLIKAELINPAP